MAWHCIRNAQPDDVQRLHDRALAFIARHNIPHDNDYDPVFSIDYYIGELRYNLSPLATTTQRNWNRVIARALKHKWARGIAYGYVGYPEKLVYINGTYHIHK